MVLTARPASAVQSLSLFARRRPAGNPGAGGLAGRTAGTARPGRAAASTQNPAASPTHPSVTAIALPRQAAGRARSTRV